MNRSNLAPGILRNNWLNIRTLPNGEKWDNQTGEDDGFAVFATPIDSLVAGWKILRTYREEYGLKTLDTIIPRWAPPGENNTSMYISRMRALTGCGAAVGLIWPNDYDSVLMAMVEQEVGLERIPPQLIVNAYWIAFPTPPNKGA